MIHISSDLAARATELLSVKDGWGKGPALKALAERIGEPYGEVGAQNQTFREALAVVAGHTRAEPRQSAGNMAQALQDLEIFIGEVDGSEAAAGGTIDGTEAIDALEILKATVMRAEPQTSQDGDDISKTLFCALQGLMVAYGAVDGRNGNSGECWDKAREAVALYSSLSRPKQ